MFNWQSDYILYTLSIECTAEKEIELNSHKVRRSNIDAKINVQDSACIRLEQEYV